MQTSNPFSVPFPYCLSETLARAYARAHEASPNTAPSAGDIFAAFAHGHAPPGTHPADPATAGASDDTDPGAARGLLDRGELLAVMREPIAWMFTLAERRAEGDRVDGEAIERVRDAILYRVDAIIAGAVASEPPRIRAADLLTVASLLVGTLDPAIVRHAVQTLGGGVIEALGALWPLIPSIAGDAADAPGSCPESCASEPGATHVHYGYVPRTAASFASPYGWPLGVAYGAPFGGPHMPRSPVPPWYWPHVGIPF
ncbi:MAG: hypothetical protein E6J90_26730 [Deltaproteobacteria bacterium]|nr:MAG: hypothetical protein E6J90_26730 [Deltaproteobacteria bacterium]